MRKQLSMQKLADYILWLNQNHADKKIYGMTIQPLMFYTLGFILNNHLLSKSKLNELYDEPFLVWRYGPVIESIYENYKVFGCEPIICCVDNPHLDTFNSNLKLNHYILSLIKYSAQNPLKFVQSTHSDSFWQKNKHKIHRWRSNIKYSLYNVKTGK